MKMRRMTIALKKEPALNADFFKESSLILRSIRHEKIGWIVELRIVITGAAVGILRDAKLIHYSVSLVTN